MSDEARRDIRMVLIVIHGANRNADDYFCAATAAVERQTRFRIEEILVLAPRFLVPSDLPPSSRLRQRYLQWEDTPDGPWRYGANAIQPAAVSSFAVLDAMLDYIFQSSNFSNLQHMSIAGHSSGGQFVQRWALLSPSFRRVVRSTQTAANLTTMRAVVANPSSYAYLSNLRWCANEGAWILPDTKECPNYNHWEWGLDTDPETTPDYVQTVLRELNVSSLIERFATRNVVYLQGSQDRCNVTAAAAAVDRPPWCQSHGLETTCPDELQGGNRWERNQRYMRMLRQVTGGNAEFVEHHHRVVVPGVGHDHSLMFSSTPGLRALFVWEEKDHVPDSSSLLRREASDAIQDAN